MNILDGIVDVALVAPDMETQAHYFVLPDDPADSSADSAAYNSVAAVQAELEAPEKMRLAYHTQCKISHLAHT